MAPSDSKKEVRQLQPAAFLTERPKFTTGTAHPSQRELDEHQKNREIITMHRVPESVTHGAEGQSIQPVVPLVNPDDIPEPSEIIDNSDLLE